MEHTTHGRLSHLDVDKHKLYPKEQQPLTIQLELDLQKRHFDETRIENKSPQL